MITMIRYVCKGKGICPLSRHEDIRGSKGTNVPTFKLGAWWRCRSHCPNGLSCGFEAAQLQGLWVRIPQGVGVHECLFLVSVVCCEDKVCGSGWSLFQRSPTECGVSECGHEALIMGRPWTTRCVSWGRGEGRDRCNRSASCSGRCISGERTIRMLSEPHQSRPGSFRERKISWLDRK